MEQVHGFWRQSMAHKKKTKTFTGRLFKALKKMGRAGMPPKKEKKKGK